MDSVSLDHEAFKSSILETLKSENPPDIYSYWAGARTASVIEHLAPIDDLWQANNLDQYYPHTISKVATEYNGKKYLLPLTQHAVGFFYNKSVFKELGLKEPVTWDDFISVCEAIKKNDLIPIAIGAKDRWPAQFWFDFLLLRTAPYEFRQDLMSGKVDYSAPQVTRVLEEWSGLIDRGFFNSGPTDISWDKGANELVYQGKAVMTLMGTWNIGYFTNADHNWVPDQDFGFFPFPEMDASIPSVALGPIDGVVIPKNANRLEGAKSVLAFLSGNDAQSVISQGSGSLSPSKNVSKEIYNPIQKKALDIISNSPHFAFNYDLATSPEVAELGLNAFSELLAFPGAYKAIQSELAMQARKEFAKQ